jgi:hypothetical protein
VRTTIDVDVLVRKKDWSEIRSSLSKEFTLEMDGAVDKETDVQVDFLFAGDDWDMVLPLPDPEKVLEYDGTLQANFLSLSSILELKTAIYLQKNRDDGIEIAAKDLADVVELLKNNQERLSVELFAKMRPQIRKELKRIRKKIGNRTRR